MQYSLRYNRLLFYGAMGILYLLLWLWHTLSAFNVSFRQAFLNCCWRSVYVIVINLVFFEYAVPFILNKRRYLFYNLLLGLVLLFAFMITWSYGLYSWRSLGVALNLYTPLGDPEAVKDILTSQMAFSMGAVLFFGVIRHTYHYTKLKQAEQQLRIEKQAAELNYLRSQTNPHFLFNTLNNIYSLARDKSDLAPESILRLSKILRFMLYETGGEYISIEQEVKIVDDYIALERLRYDQSLAVAFKTDIEDFHQALPPLLLMPLVENAFKHGVSETRGQPFVDIHLTVNNRRLLLVVKNSSEPLQLGVKENIGLKNLRRQLALLYTDYELSIQPAESMFTVVLKINLASHV